MTAQQPDPNLNPLKHVTVVGIQGMLGSGKSTARDVLVEEFGFHWVSMSTPMKRMLRALGLTEDQLYTTAGKEEVSELLCGETVRYALQTLGTEWGRDLIGPDIWVNGVRHEIGRLFHSFGHDRFVIDDIRYPNESRMVQGFEKGMLWTIRRPDVEYEEYIQKDLRDGFFGGQAIFDKDFSTIHPSERWWPAAPCDAVFLNTGTEHFFASMVRQEARGYGWILENGAPTS